MTMTPERSFSLSDRYQCLDGQILTTGVQALVRVPFDQLRADRLHGANTAAFVSGYQGSPLGGFDRELQAQRALADELGLVHTPAVNEELGATAVMGSQLVANMPDRRHDGVIGVWYGKAPGLDRAADAIRHANWAGTARKGGVLALVGDDPACKSSTIPSRSEDLLASLGLAVLYPGGVQDALDLGLHAISMSRASGLWTALKVVTPVADCSGLVEVHPDRIRPIMPTLEVDGRPWEPTLSGHIFPPFTVGLEAEVLVTRREMSLRYITENRLNRMRTNPADAWLGIIAAGYVCEGVVDALAALGLTLRDAEQLGIRVLQLGALHPLEVGAVRRMAEGCRTVLVVEDKAAHLETSVRDALYSLAERPEVIGKHDRNGAPLVPVTGIIDAGVLREPLRRVLLTRIDEQRLTPAPTSHGLRFTVTDDAVRTPYFCSGCPHNTSTKVPAGSLVGGGIGCHGMVAFIDRPDRGDIMGSAQMGGEGSQWIGMAPFVQTPHMFQNIGDGTFFHSGQLSVQAALAAGVTMTFKVLYNSAVAMTGGQDAAGLLSVPQLCKKLLAEGVSEVIITTDDSAPYRHVRLPAGASVRHRDDIIAAQEHLRGVPGVTVLIHDQQCAAEKRRDRKRGLVIMPRHRVVIDERICEGCGDCGVQSNCLSLQPVDTPFGRKTTIDQASCNLDLTCIQGDCPAFTTVVPADGGTRRSAATPPDAMPEPHRIVATGGVTIRMPGIGGTGVVTINQLLAAAAKIEGISSSAVDQTGLSQKAGPVVSTISLGQPRAGHVDVLLAFDLLASVTPSNRAGLGRDSVVIGSSSITPTGKMIGRVAEAGIDPAPYQTELDEITDASKNRYADVGALTVGLFGTSVAANVMLLGVAYQAGALPLGAAAIEQAIEINGTAVEANRLAFRWGRAWVIDPAQVERAAGIVPMADPVGFDEFGDDPELRAIVARCHADLVSYQHRRYADSYVARVRRCFEAEQRVGGIDGHARFTRVVAHQLHRVMAYKDEYEVARLALEGRERLARSLGSSIGSVTYHLHPPTLRALGMRRKLRLGRSATPMFRVLRAMRRVRGSAFDPAGRTAIRRAERALVVGYTALVDELADALCPANVDESARVVGLVEMVRGYEAVKERNLAAYRLALAEALSDAGARSLR